MTYLVIKTVDVEGKIILVDHKFSSLEDATSYIECCCVSKDIIDVTIKYIKK